ncbi:hypothetical protein F7725_028295 [Dissostichus mawsoni]|uniref:Uncharacterized protein n=1 Tax=Dissostichus mawsoni TaxID=36200 RepID=A0A7J5XGJ2_DISMA|nr:hypothetical protein F7725_028295 [Dissostichus mawsoni]
MEPLQLPDVPCRGCIVGRGGPVGGPGVRCQPQLAHQELQALQASTPRRVVYRASTLNISNGRRQLPQECDIPPSSSLEGPMEHHPHGCFELLMAHRSSSLELSGSHQIPDLVSHYGEVIHSQFTGMDWDFAHSLSSVGVQQDLQPLTLPVQTLYPLADLWEWLTGGRCQHQASCRASEMAWITSGSSGVVAL